MQAQVTVRTCDGPNCPGCNGQAAPTVETITSGTTNRPDIMWIVGYNAQRSSDNLSLNPVVAPAQFCSPVCIIAYCNALIAGTKTLAQPPTSN